MIKIDGPLPGENLLSDRRNYPWHRPPEYTDLNDAMDWILQNLTKKGVAMSILTSMEMGLPIRLITQMILMKGIEQGRWTMDTALLLAGPLSHMLVIIARKNDIDFDLGIEEDTSMVPNITAVRKLVEPKDMDEAEEEIEEDVIAPSGFGSGLMGGGASKEEEETLPNIGGFLSKNIEEEA